MSDLIALFLADLRRAIDGLKQSLFLGPDSMARAGLYARDLSDGLNSVNLPRHAEIALVLSRHYSAGHPGMELATENLLALVDQAIDVLGSEGDNKKFPNQDRELKKLAAAVSLFGEQPADFTSAAFQRVVDSSRSFAAAEGESATDGLSQAQSDPSQEEDDEAGVIDLEKMTGLMFFSGEQSEAPSGIAVNSDLSGPEGFGRPRLSMHDRLFALKTTQAIDHEVVKGCPPELSHQIRQRLLDHSNWLLTLAQEPLQRRFVGMARMIHAPNAFADADVIDYLISAMSLLPQPASIEASSQNLTLLIEMNEVPESPEALEQAARVIQILSGRIDVSGGTVRLSVPTSHSRLRVVPFVRDGVIYALSWAQFLKAEILRTPTEGLSDFLGETSAPRLCLTVKSGLQEMLLYAQEIRPFQIANAFLLPPSVEAPPWVAGVMVGEHPEPMVWVVPETA